MAGMASMAIMIIMEIMVILTTTMATIFSPVSLANNHGRADIQLHGSANVSRAHPLDLIVANLMGIGDGVMEVKKTKDATCLLPK